MSISENLPPSFEDDDVVDLSRVGNFVVVAAITAELERNSEITGNPFDVSMGKLWDLKNKTAIDFINKIEEKFRRKNKFHGFFASPTINTTPISLRQYVEAESIEFEQVANSLMQSLKFASNSVERRNLAGGNVVFVHYKGTTDSDDYGKLLVVMVAKKSGFDFDANMQPKKLSPIDTDALLQAASFDLNLFTSTYPLNDGETYLHFIEGNSKSVFFKQALGCDDAIPNKKSVENLFDAVKAFIAECKIPRGQREVIIQKVVDHLKDRASNKRPTGLDEIQNVIDKELPVSHERKGEFCKFVNEGGYEINTTFEPTAPLASKGELVDVSDASKNFTCKIKLSSLGYKGSDKPVLIDDDLRYIRIPLDAAARESILSNIGKNDDVDKVK